jgi:hypothetical protein
MANSRTGNIIFVDTTGFTLDQAVTIGYVKYIGNTSGTAAITAGTSGSGAPVWQESGATNQAADEICARCDSGLHVAVTNGAKVYIYLE